MTIAKVFMLLGALIFVSTGAVAEIRVNKAEYAEGALLVRGETVRPFQIVILDGRYKRRSNKRGQFVFLISYRPRYCAVEVASGNDLKSIEVKNCRTYIRNFPLRAPNESDANRHRN